MTEPFRNDDGVAIHREQLISEFSAWLEPYWQRVLAHLVESNSTGLGPTHNSNLLLGAVMAAINWPMVERTYEVLDLDVPTNALRLRHRLTGNTYRIAVVQLDGVEFAPPAPGAPS